jgi:hypothetical protein
VRVSARQYNTISIVKYHVSPTVCVVLVVSSSLPFKLTANSKVLAMI